MRVRTRSGELAARPQAVFSASPCSAPGRQGGWAGAALTTRACGPGRRRGAGIRPGCPSQSGSALCAPGAPPAGDAERGQTRAGVSARPAGVQPRGMQRQRARGWVHPAGCGARSLQLASCAGACSRLHEVARDHRFADVGVVLLAVEVSRHQLHAQAPAAACLRGWVAGAASSAGAGRGCARPGQVGDAAGSGTAQEAYRREGRARGAGRAARQGSMGTRKAARRESGSRGSPAAPARCPPSAASAR